MKKQFEVLNWENYHRTFSHDFPPFTVHFAAEKLNFKIIPSPLSVPRIVLEDKEDNENLFLLAYRVVSLRLEHGIELKPLFGAGPEWKSAIYEAVPRVKKSLFLTLDIASPWDEEDAAGFETHDTCLNERPPPLPETNFNNWIQQGQEVKASLGRLRKKIDFLQQALKNDLDQDAKIADLQANRADLTLALMKVQNLIIENSDSSVIVGKIQETVEQTLLENSRLGPI